MLNETKYCVPSRAINGPESLLITVRFESCWGNSHLIDRDIDFLLTSLVQDGLPEGHLAGYFVEVMERLDHLGGPNRAHTRRGRAACHPATLLSLLIFRYATGTLSSRTLELAYTAERTPPIPQRPFVMAKAWE